MSLKAIFTHDCRLGRPPKTGAPSSTEAKASQVRILAVIRLYIQVGKEFTDVAQLSLMTKRYLLRHNFSSGSLIMHQIDQ